MNGPVTSSGTTMLQFAFSTLKTDAVTLRFEGIEDSSDTMVIGRDIVNALVLILKFMDKGVQWDEQLPV
ncbi:hypothetical protein P3T76_008890 [Phytophthora citrophthora]|uniref:Uncharacterized protein n=1 Tax=Phytophthora citrophthora TaxID=4793 RepID=A0AAD9GHW0_9STRA|nr:hypothetical protein P3T76_008890 [Phytophthora citrophthora]